MAQLTSQERDALPNSAFALPGRRYPIHDAPHAIAALSRAATEHSAGSLSAPEKAIVVRKARAVLGEKPKVGDLMKNKF